MAHSAENSQVSSILSSPVVLSLKLKGKNWNLFEDEQLVASWLEIMQDPIIGNEQKSKDFWQRVQQSFQTALPTANHPGDSLLNCW
jgi:hypothetical protein